MFFRMSSQVLAYHLFLIPVFFFIDFSVSNVLMCFLLVVICKYFTLFSAVKVCIYSKTLYKCVYM